MPVYFLVGPAAAVIGIVAIFFVMRNRSTQKKSMYSSRRGQIERKVQAARARTLAPRGHAPKPSPAEMTAAAPVAPAGQSVYEAPAAQPRQAWEAPAAPPPPPYTPPAPEYTPPPPPPDFAAPAAAAAAPVSPFAEPAAPEVPVSQPEWVTPAPSEPAWTPAPAAAPDFTTPAPAEPMVSTPAPAAEPVSTPAGGGASWEVVGAGAPAEAAVAAAPDRGKKDGNQATGASWQLASGDAPTEGDDEEDGVRKPGAAMAIAQYAVLVVGLVMVLIGVLVMVANSKVT